MAMLFGIIFIQLARPAQLDKAVIEGLNPVVFAPEPRPAFMNLGLFETSHVEASSHFRCQDHAGKPLTDLIKQDA
jgi:hypothetical protein